MTRDILIYGAGGAGRELAFALSLDNDAQNSWTVLGFIDDTEKLLGELVNGLPVLGGVDYLKDYSGSLAVTLFDHPAVRKKLISRIKKNNKVQFPVLVSSSSIVSPYVVCGEGCIVNHLNFISTNTEFGDFSFVNGRTGIGHDSKIGEYTTIYAGINIGGNVSIGSGCLIGSGTTILPGMKIGDGTIIGAGSLVKEDIPTKVVAAGVPCKVLREIE